ncbi:hypothetical protein QM996_27765 (plasmid) [Sinorhizobium chiapasense]
MTIAVDDGSTSAACAGTTGHAAYAAAVTGAPIAATPIAAAIGVVRMGGGNPGKACGKTPAVVEARHISSECRKAAY